MDMGFAPECLCLRLGKALNENTQTSNLIQNSAGNWNVE